MNEVEEHQISKRGACSGNSGGSKLSKSEQNDYLAIHNKYRRDEGVTNMVGWTKESSRLLDICWRYTYLCIDKICYTHFRAENMCHFQITVIENQSIDTDFSNVDCYLKLHYASEYTQKYKYKYSNYIQLIWRIYMRIILCMAQCTHVLYLIVA